MLRSTGRPATWSLDASETGENVKMPLGGVLEGTAGGKNRETVTASLLDSIRDKYIPPEGLHSWHRKVFATLF